MTGDSPAIQVMHHFVQAVKAGLEAGSGILACLVLYTSSTKFRHSVRCTLSMDKVRALVQWATALRMKQVHPCVAH